MARTASGHLVNVLTVGGREHHRVDLRIRQHLVEVNAQLDVVHGGEPGRGHGVAHHTPGESEELAAGLDRLDQDATPPAQTHDGCPHHDGPPSVVVASQPASICSSFCGSDR